MNKIIAIIALVLASAIILGGCEEKGLEKITFKSAEKKLNKTKNENIAFIDRDGSHFAEEKEILKKAANHKKIYYVELDDNLTTSDYYQNKFTKKYPNEKDGVVITNRGKKVPDSKIFSFVNDTDVNSKNKAEKDLQKFLNK